MISGENTGYFGVSDSVEFIKNIRYKDDLFLRLKSLSAEDREFVELACKVAESGEGKSTSWLPGANDSDVLHGLDPTASTTAIKSRFEVVKDNIYKKIEPRESSDFFNRLFKGIANLFWRISADSLCTRVTRLDLSKYQTVAPPPPTSNVVVEHSNQ
jgi:hypothetical protein